MFDIDLIKKPVNLSEGEWVDDVPGYPGARFKVRSSSFKPFEVAQSRLLRSFGKGVSDITNSDEYQSKSGKNMGEHILVDWENAVVKAGKSVPYDRELADTLLTSLDERGIGRAFRGAVNYCANVVAERHLGLAQDIAGN